MSLTTLPASPSVLPTDALDLLYTNEGYSMLIEKPFQKLCETVSETKDRRNAVVLEVFAGVGTGSVVLKRLGIAVQKVIMIEFDKIAAHVYKSNHDINYNESLAKDHGGVEHVYDYERWEDFVNTDMEEFLRKHGRKSDSTVLEACLRMTTAD